VGCGEAGRFAEDGLDWASFQVGLGERQMRVGLGPPELPVMRNFPWMGCWDGAFRL